MVLETSWASNRNLAPYRVQIKVGGVHLKGKKTFKKLASTWPLCKQRQNEAASSSSCLWRLANLQIAITMHPVNVSMLTVGIHSHRVIKRQKQT